MSNSLKNFQKILSLLCAGLVSLSSLCVFSACDEGQSATVLRVYNWEDYIHEDMVAAFEKQQAAKGNNVVVEYSTFGTNENMYNELKINPGSYDLVCPSDYMMMKMIQEGMCEEFSPAFLQEGVYSKNVSPYIKGIFDENGWSKYAIGYMWGTMGFMYNPDKVDEGDASSWNLLENEKYKNKSTIKDSVRDSYFYALACVFEEELADLATQYENGQLSDSEYNRKITQIMNRTDADTIESARKHLRKIKKNIYGFEVDSGKNDMITGKIDINFCWSGDAAYSIYSAAYDEETGEPLDNGMTLYYSVPELVSNIWFDGWVIPKGINDEKQAIAEDFLNFISSPENAVKNMDYIGYTSVISGENSEIYDEYIQDGFAVDTADAEFETLKASGEIQSYNVGYFFTNDPNKQKDYTFYAYTDDVKGMLTAQYPTAQTIVRCSIMQYFDDKTNGAINQMWEDVKGAEVPLGSLIFIGAVLVVGGGAYLLSKYSNDWIRRKPKKGFKRVN